MNRLTTKVPSDGYYDDTYYSNARNINIEDGKKAFSMANNKLGQLEDLEEELGIDLDVLFEAYFKVDGMGFSDFYITPVREEKI